jgi:predicted nucleic acid-binding protein
MENMIKVFLDTNILVYAHSTSSPFFASCNQLIERAESGDIQAFLSQKSLWEFYRVLTSQKYAKVQQMALKTCDYFYESDSLNILYDTPLTTQLTLELAQVYQAYSGKIFDLNLLALALENEVEVLFTKNVKDYPKIGDLQIVDPTI